MNNAERVRLAGETLSILREGRYTVNGAEVSLPDPTPMRQGTRLVTPDDSAALADALRERRDAVATVVEVTGETTFTAARRLAHTRPGAAVAALNFASARHAGGGFLRGSLSQEEDLCRASGLYLSLTQPQVAEYYRANARERSTLYTHHLIFSPQVPVFRGDGGALLSAPVGVNVLTAPAPNAGAVAVNEPLRLPLVEPTLRERARRVLGLAAQAGQSQLVLGAWGCGVFRNDPAVVVGVFRDLLRGEARGVFTHVTFAVLDRQPGQPTLTAFRAAWPDGRPT